MNRLVTVIIYAAAGVATANWIDYAMAPQQPYGHPFLTKVALSGSITFGIACVISIFNDRYGIIAGLVAICLSWPYFALLAASLPWHNIVWLFRIHYHGNAQILSILLLMVGTLYSVSRVPAIVRSFESGHSR